ncbi:MAG: hypothetical protein PW786_01905 [Arachidicoccus sp.]|nr:hypothetical protein [Arachidicoccus sp.]
MVEKGAEQARKRVALIESHRDEFIQTMRSFGWRLPAAFSVHPLIALSTPAHVGVACDGVSVVDEFILGRFFTGHYERIGLDVRDLPASKRVVIPFYATADEAEANASAYSAQPPQL